MALPSPSYYTIGQVLEKLRDEFPSVAVSKIRYWESIGLIKPMRAPSGFRKFCDGDIEDIRRILRTQRDLGVPLEVIRKRMGSKGGLQRSDQPLLGFEEDLVAAEDAYEVEAVDNESASLDRRKYMRIVKDIENTGVDGESLSEIDITSIASITSNRGRGTKVAKVQSPQSQSTASNEGTVLGSDFEESIEKEILSSNDARATDYQVTEPEVREDSISSQSDDLKLHTLTSVELGGDTPQSQPSSSVGAVTTIGGDALDAANAVSSTADSEVGGGQSSLTSSTERSPRSMSPKARRSDVSVARSEENSKVMRTPLSSVGSQDTSSPSRRSRSVAQRSTKAGESNQSFATPDRGEQAMVVSEVTRSARSKQSASATDRGGDRKRREPRGVLDSPSFELQIPADFLSVREFARRCGASEQFVSECADFGLVKVKKHQGVAIIAEHYIDLVELARSLSIIGIAPRHLRSIKMSVSKDFSYISQLVTSPLASRNSKAKRKAVEQAAILEQNFEKFRSMVMREMLNDLFEGYDK